MVVIDKITKCTLKSDDELVTDNWGRNPERFKPVVGLFRKAHVFNQLGTDETLETPANAVKRKYTKRAKPDA